MKKIQTSRWVLVTALLVLGGTMGRTEEFAIQSFDATGKLSFNRLATAETYRVEWAPTPGGPWTSFTGATTVALASIPQFATGSYTCSVPMCYRVVASDLPWTPPNTNTINYYSITFDKNSAVATGSTTIQILGGGYTQNLNANGFSRTGYFFAGWATSSVGAVSYTNRAAYTMGADHVTLYAVWNGIPNTVTFNKNHASATGTMTTMTIPSGATSNLITCGFAFSNYVFAGWATTSNGLVVYTNRSAYTMGLSNATLWAKWDSDPSTNREKDELIFVPGGTFTQTDSTEAESFSHTVSGFCIGRYEVTYELWYAVRTWATSGGRGYAFQNNGREGHDGTTGAAPTTEGKWEPVVNINWRDAIVWCNAYSEMSGKTPVYCSNSGLTTPIKSSASASGITLTAGSFDNPYVNWSATGFRLPTEGEWQCAASYRDGTTWTSFNYASGATAMHADAEATGAVGWYTDNAGGGTHIVGQKSANQLRIHDMSGNVWEYCFDWKDSWPAASTNDYRGPAGTASSERVRRGGSFTSITDNLQVGMRTYTWVPYGSGLNHMGFRVAARP